MTPQEAKKAAEDLMEALSREAEAAERKGGLKKSQVRSRLGRLRKLLADNPNMPAPTRRDLEVCVEIEEGMLE